MHFKGPHVRAGPGHLLSPGVLTLAGVTVLAVFLASNDGRHEKDHDLPEGALELAGAEW